LLSLPQITPVEGGVPLIHEGQVVGAIGVSGVQSAQDGQVAQAGAAALAAG
jgi:glc operon protein GlcG